MTGCVILTTTLDDEAAARALARTLVDERLAACVQLGAVESVYRWRGAIESAREWLLTIKTSAARVRAAEARIAALHPYAVPEIVVTPIVGGSPAYLGWIAEQVA